MSVPAERLIVTVAEAQERMEELIDLVRGGGAVIIADESTPAVELVALPVRQAHSQTVT